MRIRRILVPTDFSDCSDHALHCAANLARNLGARVTVMHVLEPIIAGDIYGVAEISGLNAELKRSATRRIARNVARLQKRGISSRGLIGSGRAATAILDHAGKSADLIVYGNARPYRLFTSIHGKRGGKGRARRAMPRPHYSRIPHAKGHESNRSPQKTTLRDGLLGEALLFQRILVLLALELRANECGLRKRRAS